MSRCDLCGQSGGVVVEATPDPPAFERRTTRPRRHHLSCVAALRAHEAAEAARTAVEFDARVRAHEARRLAVAG